MPRQRLLRLLFVLALIAPMATQAVTLGKVRVNSFLGQPLDAEIDLVGLAANQQEDLRLRIANQDQFRRLGIVYDAILADIRFDIVRSNERWLVRVRTGTPVVEPFLDFPLMMTWPSGQLVRQYTLLLDPPRRIDSARVTGGTPPPPPVVPKAPPPNPVAQDIYGPVQRGETLWPIAQRLKPSDVTTQQMALALFRANPDAFIDGNMNLLRAGARLAIPSRDFIDQIDRATARAEFAAQAKGYQRATPQIATSPPIEPPKIPVPSAEDVGGSAQEDPSRADSDEPGEAGDARLQIVTDLQKADPASNDTQDLQQQLLVTMEEIESNRLATGAIRARVDELETELIRLHQLVQLKDEQIAALQSELSTREGEEQPASDTAPGDKQQPPEQERSATVGPIAAQRSEPRDVASEVIRMETSAAPTGTSPAWYESYLWVVWAVLAFLGMTALLLAFRRPKEAPDELPLTEFPGTQAASARGSAAPEETLAAPPAPRAAPTSAPEDTQAASEPAQDRDIGSTTANTDDGVTDTLLNDMLEESELQADRPPRHDADSEISDEDIASWINELGNDAAPTQSRDVGNQTTTDDSDIPSILTELDDQLSATSPAEPAATPGVQLDPLDDAGEDETFAMSLDLARAYLEIGDQEGARDMLKQALSVAHDPDHRRQIEELLEQID